MKPKLYYFTVLNSNYIVENFTSFGHNYIMREFMVCGFFNLDFFKVIQFERILGPMLI